MSATTHLNRGLRIFFSEFVRVSLRWPSQALFFARTVLWQSRAARLRARNAAEGLTIPPIANSSITNGCNLSYAGRHTLTQVLTPPPLPGTMLCSNEKLRASRRCP
jgi:hypothetical protein